MKYFTKDIRPNKDLFLEGPSKYLDEDGNVLDESENPWFECNVEVGMKTKDRVYQLLRSGYQKEKALYEFYGNQSVPDDYEDISRRPGLDIADCSMAMRQMETARREREERRQESEKRKLLTDYDTKIDTDELIDLTKEDSSEKSDKSDKKK